jgi:hypothetical protein
MAKRTKEDYEKLLDIARGRWKAEIDLLWQRSLFFWGFTVAAFTGYAYFFTKLDYQNALFITCFGLLSSLIWTWINKGSKFWQEYWEQQIKNVNKKVPEFDFFDKTKDFKLEKKGFLGGKHFSPSRLMIALCIYVTLAWGMILLMTSWIVISGSLPSRNIMGWGKVIAIIFTITYAVWVYFETNRIYPNKTSN